MRFAPGQKIELDSPRLEIVKDLVGHAAGGVELLEIIHVEVGDSRRRIFPSAPNFFERLDGFRDWHTAAPVEQIQVDDFGAEAPQTSGTRFWQTSPTRVVACGYTFVTRKTDSRCPSIASATTSSAPPSAYHLGGVDQGHAESHSEPQRRHLLGSIASRLAHFPRSLAQHGDGRFCPGVAVSACFKLQPVTAVPQKTRSPCGHAEGGRASRLSLTNYFLTISAFSSIETPPLLAILPFKVTVLPASGASSSFIGLCAPTTR